MAHHHPDHRNDYRQAPIVGGTQDNNDDINEEKSSLRSSKLPDWTKQKVEVDADKEDFDCCYYCCCCEDCDKKGKFSDRNTPWAVFLTVISIFNENFPLDGASGATATTPPVGCRSPPRGVLQFFRLPNGFLAWRLLGGIGFEWVIGVERSTSVFCDAITLI